MSKFKPGDRVTSDYSAGTKSGTVSYIDKRGRPWVNWDSGMAGIWEVEGEKYPLRLVEWVWIKMGAAGKYEKFNTPYEAGSAVAKNLSSIPDWQIRPKEREHLRFGYQVSAINIEPVYIGHNRISLFWGDDSCHWIRDLSPAEQKDFERGLTTGG